MTRNNRRPHPSRKVRARQEIQEDLTRISFSEIHPEPTGEQTVSNLLTYDEARERLIVIGVLGRSS